MKLKQLKSIFINLNFHVSVITDDFEQFSTNIILSGWKKSCETLYYLRGLTCKLSTILPNVYMHGFLYFNSSQFEFNFFFQINVIATLAEQIQYSVLVVLQYNHWIVHMVCICCYFTPHTVKLLGGYIGFTPSVRPSVCPSICPSVCPTCRARSVAPTVLVGSIWYLCLLSSNFRRLSVTCKVSCKISKLEFLAIFLNL